MLTNELMDAQRALETSSIQAGVDRYWAKQDRVEDTEGLDRRAEVAKLIRGAIPLVSAELTRWTQAAQGARGRKPTGLKELAAIDPDLAAYAGLSRTFRELPKGGHIADICGSIGRTIQIELEAAAIAATDDDKAERFAQKAEGESSERVLERRHAAIRDELGVGLDWTRRTQILVGQAVLNAILIALPDIFVQETVKDQWGTASVIQLTDEAGEAIIRMTQEAAWLHPSLKPMVVSPRPWTSLGTGCYYNPALSRAVPLVRSFSSEHRKLLKEAIGDGSMREVLDALNAIQETRWAVDTRVLEVVRWVRDEGKRPSDSFPLAQRPDLPAKMADDEWAAASPAKRIAASRRRKTIRDIRSASSIECGVLKVDMETAEHLTGFEAFYLPHSLDFRGRTYAVPHFNHQRSDHLKGLFRFADGVPLGPQGGEWLMIHLANCGDFGKISKKPFADRIAWVRENEGDILMAAAFPADSFAYWSAADSPFCFLQACFEYAAWMASGFSEDFASTIPVAADGSCSGLQHYAAITRSAQEAHHVNLTPRDDVGDIYSVVAEAAVPMLKAFAASGDMVSANGINIPGLVLSQGFGRSEVKRNVMTYFYGSARFGMRDQHMEDTMRPLADKVAMGELTAHPYEVEVERKDGQSGEKSLRMDGGYSCAHVMATATYAAVVSVAPKADAAAAWIQKVAATLAHESLSMIWRTPTGMPVVQRYSEYVSKAINLWLYDRKVLVPSGTDKVAEDGKVLTRVQLLVREAPTKRVDKRRMKSASAPNVIHSMDGAHLQRSVAMAREAGIQHFAMIHDSFGTHAGNMAAFGRIVREALVATYADYCPLAELDRYARSVLSDDGIEKLPPLPAKGALDLEAIKASLYAFA